jgi:hypothetical protein
MKGEFISADLVNKNQICTKRVCEAILSKTSHLFRGNEHRNSIIPRHCIDCRYHVALNETKDLYTLCAMCTEESE